MAILGDRQVTSPPELALWLLGLGINLIWNPPARPQENGAVERSQGVGKKWGEPHTCVTDRELQRRMDKFDQLQRERYPFHGQQSRLQSHPELTRPRRRYTRTRERASWRWDLVTEHLKEYAVTRKVDIKGSVSLYNRNHYVGISYARQHVVVMYDAIEHQWEFYNAWGQILRRRPAPELSAQRICALDVLHHKKSRQPKSRQNPLSELTAKPSGR